jgi:uncharacterized protein YrzB (UPF0473 family)
MTEIDKLYDEENQDLIFLFNEKGQEIAFEQIALIPILKNTYAILKPVVPLEGLGEDEGLVFEIKTNDNEEYLALVVDEDIIDDVFDIYFKLVEENEGE